eukprot:TRINITY_DN111814_c0_g1_i1.p1 TRINITY_DN111814_c0_g1~~TRINITY_DN111814_c0_g1_i1.p1  ORF type:complete len:642 (+),score=95.73 TRINITY_DN111814_c0_g1_i1:86-2011(+)
MGCGCCSCAKTPEDQKHHAPVLQALGLGSGALKGIGNFLGVRDYRPKFSGATKITSQLQEPLQLQFCDPNLLGDNIKVVELEAGGTYDFDPGESGKFDFLLVVNRQTQGQDIGFLTVGRRNVLRGGEYAIEEISGSRKVNINSVSLPTRKKSKRLANIPGLSFSFSASGWLVMYHLGVAECLQNNGIMQSPYVRASGASGGALAACLALYGGDLPAVRDCLKEKAREVHNDVCKGVMLRRFVLDAMKLVVKDGSYKHPAIRQQRLEIAVTTTTGHFADWFAKVAVAGKETRMKEFPDSTAVAIALLASSTCGISGLPFVYKDEDGKEKTVADGAFSNFLPAIDKNSITVKPFTAEGLDVLGLTGRRPDVGPTEYVPSSFGGFPPAETMLDHLYELGYRDMEAWLDQFLEERVQKIAESAPESVPRGLPEVQEEFHCDNNGMLWIEDLMSKVPLDWKDMIKGRNFHKDLKQGIKPVHEGWLTLEEVSYYGMDETGKPQVKQSVPAQVRRWASLSKVDLRWREKDVTDEASEAAAAQDDLDDESLEEMMRGLVGSGALHGSQERLVQRAKHGRIHNSWINGVDSDPVARERLLLKTSNYVVTLRAESAAEADAWRGAVEKELRALHDAFLQDGHHYDSAPELS